jgi:2-iminobutanoate/2-iminopropanoate deaminase
MKIEAVNASDAPKAMGYSQAVKLTDFKELVFVSGQIPETVDGEVPADFDGQCRLVWRNLEAQLRAAGMSFDNLVKVTTYLSHPSQREAQSRIRREVLGDRSVALTVILCDIYASKWLLEIEAIAAA